MGFGEVCFESAQDEGVVVGTTVRITAVKEDFEAAWREAELGNHDNLSMYLDMVGKIVDIDEDDDTVKLQWGNLDTSWIPIKACMV